MIVLPTHGQSLWDVPLDTALHNLMSGGFTPNDFNYQNWAFDPNVTNAGDGHTNGTVRMVKLPPLPRAYTISSVKYFVATAAVTPTAGQNFAGIYNSAGTRVAVSADVSADTSTTGMKTFTQLVPYVTIPNEALYVALLFNAATPLAGVAGAAATGREALYNLELPAATARYTSGPTAQTSLPASITMGARTVFFRSSWAAVA